MYQRIAIVKIEEELRNRNWRIIKEELEELARDFVMDNARLDGKLTIEDYLDSVGRF